MFIIRKAQANDIEKISELIHHTIQICYPAVYPSEVVDFFIEYHSPGEIKRRADQGILLVLEEVNEIRATGFLMDDEMGGLYVHPDYQKQGIGTAIVKTLLKEAAKNNCEYIRLDSTPLAKRLYLKMGFKMVAPAVQMVGDVPLHYYKMEKYLR
jgi:putative acetyltransferase